MSAGHPAIPASVFLGHAFLVATAVMYGVYWVLQYYGKFTIVQLFLLIASISIGFVGLFLFYTSSAALLMPARTQNAPILLGGTALFVLSVILMQVIFKRPFTSEIFFAFLWAVSEMNILYSIHSTGRVGKAPFAVMAACVLLCTAVNLVCYRIHFELTEYGRFVNGLVPYCVSAFFMTAILIILLLNG